MFNHKSHHCRRLSYLTVFHTNIGWTEPTLKTIAFILGGKRTFNQFLSPVFSFFVRQSAFDSNVFVFHWWNFFVVVVKAMKRKGQSLFTVLFWALWREWSPSWLRILAANGNHFAIKSLVSSHKDRFCSFCARPWVFLKLVFFGFNSRPFWLSPTQAIVIPVSPKYEEYAIKVCMIIRSVSLMARRCFLVYVFSVQKSWYAITHRPSWRYVCVYEDCVRGVLACMAGLRRGGKSKWARQREVPNRDLPALRALVFPLSLPLRTPVRGVWEIPFLFFFIFFLFAQLVRSRRLCVMEIVFLGIFRQEGIWRACACFESLEKELCFQSDSGFEETEVEKQFYVKKRVTFAL